ncbi:MAG: hypothetical protein P8X57_15555 [Cyclobacteriaceae bacterium]
MAKANPGLIGALRATADQLRKSENYQWGHMGSCNCGHLAQELTRLNSSEIHQRAMEKHGDWSEQLNDYCPTSGLLMDDLITQMLDAGLDMEDLRHLERLSDPFILRELPEDKRYLRHNRRDDVILYLKTWASVLEDKWAKSNELPEINIRPRSVAL